jgi:hypothetical protein
MSKKSQGAIQRWGDKINWKRRVKAVCKPCWEIKYCPYGPLVEEFPLKETPDDKSCRIFGHDCPVFYVAEPLTETKELRNVSRSIPRITQFRVLKRDNQICRDCGRSIKDQDVEFDHIIPWAKGGSSDDHNVKLLCRTCNRRKGKKFEDQYLVASLSEHLVDPAPFDILRLIIEFVNLSHTIHKQDNRDHTQEDICRWFGRRKVRNEDKIAAEMIFDIQNFLTSKKPTEVTNKLFDALKYRWGYPTREFHKLQESAQLHGVTADELLSAEASLLQRLGWPIEMSESSRNKWLRL